MPDYPITKETLAYLAALARIDLEPKEEERLLLDLQRILAYVSELRALDTSGVTPMNGGTSLTNVFRADGERTNTHRGAGTGQFPETKDGYLKVPSVFGNRDSSAVASE